MDLPVGDRELVQIVDAALADAARRAGAWLVCRLGCTQCCYGAFAISELDALRLGAGMDALHDAKPALAAEIMRRARAWIDEHGAGFPGDRETGRLGDTEADRERFEEFANEAACPALDPATGRCDVYEWRPMTCRVFGPPVRMDDGAGAERSATANCALRAQPRPRSPPARCRFRMSSRKSCSTEFQSRAKPWLPSRCCGEVRKAANFRVADHPSHHLL